MHQSGRIVFRAAAPLRVRHSPSHRGPASRRLQQRNGMAGEQPSPLEWRSLEPDHRRRADASEIGDLGRLLAPEGSMTDQSNDHALSRLIAIRAELAGTVAEL